MTKRISAKMLRNFIDSTAYINPSDIPGDEDGQVYLSKIDNSYIMRVGMEDYFKMFLKYGITRQIQNREIAQNVLFYQIGEVY